MIAARHHADQRHEERELREQPCAEFARAQAHDDDDDERRHHQQKDHRDRDVGRVQPLVIAVEEFGVRARGGQQYEQQHGRDRDRRHQHAHDDAADTGGR
ncbi:hypothetical protein QF001_008166 [Paraburkholderia youngii]